MSQRKKVGIIDFETTDLDEEKGYVHEIGLVIAYADNYEYIRHWKADIHSRWASAAFIALHQQMRGCSAVMSYNISFDGRFLRHNFKNAGITHNYHLLCIMSMAVLYLKQKGLERSKSLESMCELFEIAKEPRPHKAINGALAAHSVLRKMCISEESTKAQHRNLRLVA
jgi:inhibitor of KinA sporulation pathway (predicted exonuclease)